MNLLAEHRFLTGWHVAGLAHGEAASQAAAVRAAARQMSRLEGFGLVSRLPRLVGGTGGGSRRTIWHLTEGGWRLLRGRAGLGQGEHRPARRRPSQPSTTFLAHTLLLADIRLTLERIGHSQTADEARTLETVQTEPACWRSWTGAFGQPMTLRPDLYAEVACGQYIDLWFVEGDLGTEHLPAVVRKAEAYEAYRSSGREQARRGAFPLVLWVTPDQRRADAILEAIGQAGRCDPAIHRAVAFDELDGFLNIGRPS
jgi:hypothetical protein